MTLFLSNILKYLNEIKYQIETQNWKDPLIIYNSFATGRDRRWIPPFVHRYVNEMYCSKFESIRIFPFNKCISDDLIVSTQSKLIEYVTKLLVEIKPLARDPLATFNVKLDKHPIITYVRSTIKKNHEIIKSTYSFIITPLGKLKNQNIKN